MKYNVHIKVETPDPIVVGKFKVKFRSIIEYDYFLANSDALVKLAHLKFGLNSIVHFKVVPFANS